MLLFLPLRNNLATASHYNHIKQKFHPKLSQSKHEFLTNIIIGRMQGASWAKGTVQSDRRGYKSGINRKVSFKENPLGSFIIKGTVHYLHLKISALCQVSHFKGHGIFQIAVFLQFAQFIAGF